MPLRVRLTEGLGATLDCVRALPSRRVLRLWQMQREHKRHFLRLTIQDLRREPRVSHSMQRSLVMRRAAASLKDRHSLDATVGVDVYLQNSRAFHFTSLPQRGHPDVQGSQDLHFLDAYNGLWPVAFGCTEAGRDNQN